MLTVISPAKNLDFDSPIPKLKTSQPQLLDESQILVDQLKAFAPHDISALMKLSDKLGQLNYERYQQWLRPFNAKNARPAILAFNGDVYQGLDASVFDTDDFDFAQQHLRILSGLYGVLRPLDLMQPYRLEMSTRLRSPRGNDLYGFWGNIITEKLNQQIKKADASVLLNLASNEYFKSIKIKDLNAKIVEPVFKDWKNNEYKIISFFAKKARGLMSRYIIKNKLTHADDIKNFNVAGYEFNKAMSSEQKWVFTRK